MNSKPLLILTIITVVTSGFSINQVNAVVDNFLFSFGSYGSGQGQFINPAGIVIDSAGNVYVSDSGNNRIQKFTSSGTFISSFGLLPSSVPLDVAIDPSGNLIIADNGADRILKYTSSGTFISSFGSFCRLVDSAGCVDPDGPLGPLVLGDGQFNDPAGLAVDSFGNILVNDKNNNRIQIFTNSGAFISKFGSFGSGLGQLNFGTDVAVDNTGNIIIVDTGNHRIQKLTSSGTPISSFGSFGIGPNLFNQPISLSSDLSGNMYITEWGNHIIHVYTSSGAFIEHFGGYGSSDSRFTYPFFLAFDSLDNLYVADNGNHRVQVFESPNSSPDCSGAIPNQSTIWPPNHKMVNIAISGIIDSDGDVVSLTIDSIQQDEPVSGKGAGNTSPDGIGSGTSSAKIRAERSGIGDGRIYEISFSAYDGNGGTCTGSVLVGVPHNQSSTAIDSTVRFDSTQ